MMNQLEPIGLTSVMCARLATTTARWAVGIYHSLSQTVAYLLAGIKKDTREFYAYMAYKAYRAYRTYRRQTSPALRAPSLLGGDAERNFDHPS